jgi:non-ribosomal peptide synthetase component F
LDGSLPATIQDDNFLTSTARILLVPNGESNTRRPQGCKEFQRVHDILAQTPPLREPIPHRTQPDPSANAYLCFTSGSTGKPKGVVCRHAGLVAFQRNHEVRLFAGPGRKIAQIMSPAFDGSIHEIFSTLSYGATLVLNDSTNPFSILHLVDSAILTPSIAKVLDPVEYPTLQAVSVQHI